MSYIKINKYMEWMKEYHEKYPDSITAKDIPIFKDWASKYSVTHFYQGSIQWAKVNGKKRFIEHLEKTPREDHAAMFKTELGNIIFVSQPYINIEKAEELDLYNWAAARGLMVEISEELSWHYPGKTILIQYTLGNPEVLEAYLRHLMQKDK